MKSTLTALTALSALALLSACYSREVVHEKPVVVQPGTTTVVPGGMTPGSVESTCPNGYDNATHRCY